MHVVIFSGCMEVDGMANSQFIPNRNVETRATSRVPESGRNAFSIKISDWKLKPRIDVLMNGDGTPVQITRVVLNSGPKQDTFRIKYKATEDQEIWWDYVAPSDDTITV